MFRIPRYMLSFLILTSVATAHRVNIFTQVRGKQVVCQCFYSNGNPVTAQTVQVTTVNGAIIAEGKTDSTGLYSFYRTTGEDLFITLDAGMGHAAKTTLAKEDLTEPEANITTKKSPPANSIKTSETPEQSPLTKEQIEEIVEQVMDEKIHSLVHLIQKQQRAPSFITIIGGIGYIIGIFGLIMFFKSRKKK